ESPLGWVTTRASGGRRDSVIEKLDEASRCSKRLLFPFFKNCRSNFPGEAFIAIELENSRELTMGIGIEHVSRCHASGWIHAHVQRSINLVGKASVGCIQLHRRHSQIK